MARQSGGKARSLVDRSIIRSYTTLVDAYADLVPEYKSWAASPVIITIEKWDPERIARMARRIRKVGVKRSENRIKAYLPMDELARVKKRIHSQKKADASIRFGAAEKQGGGYHGKERGDYCLIAGSIDGKRLNLFYRSLEMIGGFGYDLVLIDELARHLDFEFRSVRFHAARAMCFALRGNSNETFYPRLNKILGIYHE